MQTQHGYSLVELVVGLAVLMGLTALAVPAFNSSIANSQIRTVASAIHDGLQLARMEAIKRNTKIRFTLSSDSSWQFGCSTVTTTCPAVIASKSASEGAGTGLTIQANVNTVVFSSFGSRDPSVASALSEVTVSNARLGASEIRSLRVLLSAGGYARMCDPAISASGDPRKC